MGIEEHSAEECSLEVLCPSSLAGESWVENLILNILLESIVKVINITFFLILNFLKIICITITIYFLIQDIERKLNIFVVFFAK